MNRTLAIETYKRMNRIAVEKMSERRNAQLTNGTSEGNRMNQTTNHSVQLQGIGKVQGKPASELKVGDVTVWNYGYLETIQTVELRGKSVYVTLLCQKTQKTFERRLLQSRIVAVTAKSL